MGPSLPNSLLCAAQHFHQALACRPSSQAIRDFVRNSYCCRSPPDWFENYRGFRPLSAETAYSSLTTPMSRNPKVSTGWRSTISLWHGFVGLGSGCNWNLRQFLPPQLRERACNECCIDHGFSFVHFG